MMFNATFKNLSVIPEQLELEFKYNTIFASLKLSHTTNLFKRLDIFNKFRM